MAFGPRLGDLSAIRALGSTDEERITACVGEWLNPGAIGDTACDERLTAQGFTTLGKSLTQLWTDHTKKEGIDGTERRLSATETLTATFIRAVYSKRQLLEVLTDFWHNHFNVYAWDTLPALIWVHYDRDVIRANALGNFRTLLSAVAHSPEMLYFLDNITNTSAGPNENLAREMFELHAMGADGLSVFWDAICQPMNVSRSSTSWLPAIIPRLTCLPTKFRSGFASWSV